MIHGGHNGLTSAAESLRRERAKRQKNESDLQQILESTRQTLRTTAQERDDARQELVYSQQQRDATWQELDKTKSNLKRTNQELSSVKSKWHGNRTEHDKLRKQYMQLKGRWDREKDSVRAGKLSTALYRVGRVALFAMPLLVLLGLFNPESRSAIGRIEPALSLLIAGASQASVTPVPATQTQSMIVIPTATTTARPTATPKPAIVQAPTQTSRPTVTPTWTLRPTFTPTAMYTPSPTATPRPTATASLTSTSTSTPRLLSVLYNGVLARACPRIDCDVLTRLARGSQVTVMEEVEGEAYRESALWYRVALPENSDDAFVHSSLLGPPTPVAPDR